MVRDVIFKVSCKLINFSLKQSHFRLGLDLERALVLDLGGAVLEEGLEASDHSVVVLLRNTLGGLRLYLSSLYDFWFNLSLFDFSRLRSRLLMLLDKDALRLLDRLLSQVFDLNGLLSSNIRLDSRLSFYFLNTIQSHFLLLLLQLLCFNLLSLDDSFPQLTLFFLLLLSFVLHLFLLTFRHRLHSQIATQAHNLSDFLSLSNFLDRLIFSRFALSISVGNYLSSFFLLLSLLGSLLLEVLAPLSLLDLFPLLPVHSNL